MKIIKNSFLYFYFATSLLCLLNDNDLYSQEKTDSTYFYYHKVISPKNNSDLLSSYNFYHQDKISALLKKDTLRAISDLRMIAECQLRMGMIYESQGAAIEAINLLDNFKQNDSLYQSRYGLLTHLGIVYRTSSDYNKAIEVYKDALKITNKQKDSITIINNIANIYYDLKQYELALEQFEVIYNKAINNSDHLQKARVLNNLGAVQTKLNLSEAFNNLNISLTIRKRENDIIGTYLTYKNLFYFYKDRNDKNKAKLFADSAYIVVNKINNKTYVKDALSLYIELSEDIKVIEYKRLTDSITKTEQIRKNEYSFNKYRYDKQEKIAQENALQREKEKQLKLTYLGLAIFILLLLISSYFVFKARTKKEKLEQIYKTETRISKKIHDEVANEIYQVMTKLQSNTSDSNEILDDIEEIYNKTRDISKENAAIDIDEGFAEMLLDLLVSYKNDEISIITKDFKEINWEEFSNLKKTTIYRVLQELMTNMRKHSDATLVVLTFKQENNKTTIQYTDNGIGCELEKKVGLQNTETRMESINGSINFESNINKGFKAKISI